MMGKRRLSIQYPLNKYPLRGGGKCNILRERMPPIRESGDSKMKGWFDCVLVVKLSTMTGSKMTPRKSQGRQEEGQKTGTLLEQIPVM